MSIKTTRGASPTGKAAAANTLISLLTTKVPEEHGELVTARPLWLPDKSTTLDAVWITPDRGVVVFDLFEGSDPRDYGARQDLVYCQMNATLMGHPELVERVERRASPYAPTRLKVPIHTCSFTHCTLPHHMAVRTPEHNVADPSTLAETVALMEWPARNRHTYDWARFASYYATSMLFAEAMGADPFNAEVYSRKLEQFMREEGTGQPPHRRPESRQDGRER